MMLRATAMRPQAQLIWVFSLGISTRRRVLAKVPPSSTVGPLERDRATITARRRRSSALARPRGTDAGAGRQNGWLRSGHLDERSRNRLRKTSRASGDQGQWEKAAIEWQAALELSISRGADRPCGRVAVQATCQVRTCAVGHNTDAEARIFLRAVLQMGASYESDGSS
jgi:hypothetical protein